MRIDRDTARLATLARSQLGAITDLELADVWSVLCAEIENGLPAEGWFSIAAIVDALAAGGGRGMNALHFDVDHEGGDPNRVIVCSGFVLPERLSCPREPLLAELRRLLDRFRKGPSSSPAR